MEVFSHGYYPEAIFSKITRDKKGKLDSYLKQIIFPVVNKAFKNILLTVQKYGVIPEKI